MAKASENIFPKVRMSTTVSSAAPSGGEWRFEARANGLYAVSSNTGSAGTGPLGAAGGSALTIKDEGVALATDATSLDFVGAGVVASGAGAAKTITIAGGASSGLVLITQQTASASATLDFASAISATYDEYEIHFVGIVPATNAVAFQMQMGTGGGPTYDTGANYNYGMLYSGIGDAPTQVSGSAAGAINLANSISTTASYSVNGSIRLYSPGGAAYKFIEGKTQAMAAGNLYQWSDSGVYLSTTAVTAFRFLMSAGNIASGTIRVYGIAK